MHFQGVKLYPILKGAIAGELVHASELFHEKITIVLVTRRPGCILCREEAITLATAHQKGELGDVNLMAVIKQIAPVKGAATDKELGVEEFQTVYFKNNPVFLDHELGFYRYLGSKSVFRQTLHTLNPFQLYSDFNAVVNRLKSKGVAGNYHGDYSLMGGLVIVSPTKGVIYKRNEVSGSEVPLHEIISAIQFEVATPASIHTHEDATKACHDAC